MKFDPWDILGALALLLSAAGIWEQWGRPFALLAVGAVLLSVYVVKEWRAS